MKKTKVILDLLERKAKVEQSKFKRGVGYLTRFDGSGSCLYLNHQYMQKVGENIVWGVVLGLLESLKTEEEIIVFRDALEAEEVAEAEATKLFKKSKQEAFKKSPKGRVLSLQAKENEKEYLTPAAKTISIKQETPDKISLLLQFILRKPPVRSVWNGLDRTDHEYYTIEISDAPIMDGHRIFCARFWGSPKIGDHMLIRNSYDMNTISRYQITEIKYEEPPGLTKISLCSGKCVFVEQTQDQKKRDKEITNHIHSSDWYGNLTFGNERFEF